MSYVVGFDVVVGFVTWRPAWRMGRRAVSSRSVILDTGARTERLDERAVVGRRWLADQRGVRCE